MTWEDSVSKYIHTLFVIIALGTTFVLLGFTFTANADQNATYLANSFLSAYYSDTPAVTFSPVGDPYTPSQVTDTYYQCLYKAQVGVNSEFGCKSDSLAEHTACLIQKTNSREFKVNRTVDAFFSILSSYPGDSWNLTTLPSFTTAFNRTELRGFLNIPWVTQTLRYSLSLVDGSLANDLLNALDVLDSNIGTQGCLRSVQLGAGILHDISPVYDTLWACTAGIIHTEPANHRAYDMCIPQTAWPALDVMQTPYSSSFLGSYNKHFTLIVGMWLMCSFGVYSAWAGAPSFSTSNGKPAFLFARGGKALTVLAFVWNAAIIIMVFVRGFGDPANANYFPMTVQTVVVTLLFSVLGTMYFGRELYELFAYSGDDPAATSMSRRSSSITPVPAEQPGIPGNLRYSQPRRGQQLSYFMRIPEKGSAAELYQPQYTPLFVPAWSDCWVLCDGLITLGIIGYSKDVVTADIVMCFLYVLAAAAANSSLTRLLYHGYINEVPSAEGEYSSLLNYRTSPSSKLTGDEKHLDGIRVMAMVSDLASILFSMVYWYLMLRHTSSLFIVFYVVMSSVLPTLAWLVLNIGLDFDWSVTKNSLFYPAQYIFIYNVVIRTIFVSVIIMNFNSKSVDMYTSDTSLQAMLYLFNVDFLPKNV